MVANAPKIDWKPGMMVRRSDHALKENTALKPTYGIVVGVSVHTEDSKPILYPRVHWQGEVCDHLVHPMNVSPAETVTAPEPQELTEALATLARNTARWESIAAVHKAENKALKAELAQLRGE